MSPLETGVHTAAKGQYFDNDGEMNVAGGRPDERHGWHGSFTHGTTTLAGGIPHEQPQLPRVPSNHGIVLFVSSTLVPDLTGETQYKPGTTDERVGPSGVQARWRRTSPGATSLTEITNHGTVLNVVPSLKCDMSYEGAMNMAGGRPTERLGAHGSFTPGHPIFEGGAPHDVPVSAELTHGNVLFTSAALHPDMRAEGHVKPGTQGERQGNVGSFEHGDLHLRMPSAAEAELWKEAGQSKGARRFAGGHFLAGQTILAGATPHYKQ